MARATRPRFVLVWLSAAVLVSACSSVAPRPPSGSQASSSRGAAASSAGVTYHTVHRGDTLYSIAWRYGIDYRSVAYWNGIREPYTIYPGQRLRLLDVTTPPKTRRSKRTAASTARASAPRRNQGSKTAALATIKHSGSTASDSSAKKGAGKASVGSDAARPRDGQEGVERWVWPVRGKVITSFCQSGQKGIDISGRSGQPIQATAGGRVVYSGGGLIGYGKLIIVKHNERYLSAYAHNHQVFVKEGDKVQSGQRIATMGSSGTDRVKLHFEIRRDGKPVNPLRYLPR